MSVRLTEGCRLEIPLFLSVRHSLFGDNAIVCSPIPAIHSLSHCIYAVRYPHQRHYRRHAPNRVRNSRLCRTSTHLRRSSSANDIHVHHCPSWCSSLSPARRLSNAHLHRHRTTTSRWSYGKFTPSILHRASLSSYSFFKLLVSACASSQTNLVQPSTPVFKTSS